MKKVLALALALIMTLALGVAAFAESTSAGTTVVWDGWSERFEPDFGEFPIWNWNIAEENVVVLPYNYGDFALMIDGSDTFENLFGPEIEYDKMIMDDGEYTLSSIKV
ncbi:MAG TPA: hypothetical protein PKV62_04265, partial [Oscillospiraceae bacterium]|nr:hypothetical protein [Oscillospiraceae bacterium]